MIDIDTDSRLVAAVVTSDGAEARSRLGCHREVGTVGKDERARAPEEVQVRMATGSSASFLPCAGFRGTARRHVDLLRTASAVCPV